MLRTFLDKINAVYCTVYSNWFHLCWELFWTRLTLYIIQCIATDFTCVEAFLDKINTVSEEAYIGVIVDAPQLQPISVLLLASQLCWHTGLVSGLWCLFPAPKCTPTINIPIPRFDGMMMITIDDIVIIIYEIKRYTTKFWSSHWQQGECLWKVERQSFEILLLIWLWHCCWLSCISCCQN